MRPPRYGAGECRKREERNRSDSEWENFGHGPHKVMMMVVVVG